MQNIKNSLFLYFSKGQKSQIFSSLRTFYKKYSFLNSIELTYKFIENEKYYLEINNPHFEFLRNYLDDEDFCSDLKKFFDFCEFENKQKEQMKPYLEKQKEYAKVLRKKAQEYKMSKLKPTKKQLFYYDKITKAHNIEKKDVSNASRLDLKNWITEIIEKYDY